ncbi:MAG: hypothetical protein DMF58_08900 [Acidobacteria bacterium]|nr:MAG: hypothetical protein DMF58_08900 [Acidobacteriota bacterium]
MTRMHHSRRSLLTMRNRTATARLRRTRRTTSAHGCEGDRAASARLESEHRPVESSGEVPRRRIRIENESASSHTAAAVFRRHQIAGHRSHDDPDGALMHSAPRALIAGLGLIGGSIGIALRARGWRVAFIDPNVDLHEAQRAGAADERVESLDGPTDVIVIATPIDVAIKLLGARHSALGTITSVASVMEPLREAARTEKFVAGHPLAGSHERGLAAARADLMRDRVWFLERHEEIIDRMVRDCGARVEIVNAKEHDAAVAVSSHLSAAGCARSFASLGVTRRSGCR